MSERTETPRSIPEQYLEKVIWRRYKETSRRAALTTCDDYPIIDEAIYYTELVKRPNPYESDDDRGLEVSKE